MSTRSGLPVAACDFTTSSYDRVVRAGWIVADFLRNELVAFNDRAIAPELECEDISLGLRIPAYRQARPGLTIQVKLIERNLPVDAKGAQAVND